MAKHAEEQIENMRNLGRIDATRPRESRDPNVNDYVNEQWTLAQLETHLRQSGKLEMRKCSVNEDGVDLREYPVLKIAFTIKKIGERITSTGII